MGPIDDLPADQRAVLQLVLQRGRSYGDISSLLSIDRAAVRQRALSALDALGPRTAVAPERRALITDYLLGQLPPRLSDDTRDHLADAPAERAWARVVASELSQFSSGPLPEIPVEPARRQREPAPPQVEVEPAADEPPAETGESAVDAAPTVTDAAPGVTDEGTPTRAAGGRLGVLSPGTAGKRSSRLGGAILLAIVVAAIIVAIVLIATGGSDHKKKSTGASSSTAATTSTTGTQVVGQINLTSPSGTKAAGIAEILKQGSVSGIAIVAQHLTPNTKHDAYAVWLYNSAADSQILGFVNPPVAANGTMRTEGRLPTNAAHFKQLIVTLETQAKPKAPGKIVLQGTLTPA